MKKDRIGLFEKWNGKTNKLELSITKVQMLMFTPFTMWFIYSYFVVECNPVTSNSIMLLVVLGLFNFAPKAIKDLTDMKDKIK